MAENSTGGGTQLGGGPNPSDTGAPGGSSGSGGYGNAQNQANHQGQQTAPTGRDERQSRGERYDEEQGGGRGPGSVSDDAIAQVGGSDGNPLTRATDEFFRNQEEGQDRDRSAIDFERDAES